jgi:hypothetical protein
MKKIHKIAAIVGLIGLIFAIFSPILADATTFNRKLLDEKAKDIKITGGDTMQRVYNFEFELKKGQKLVVEFGVPYENCSATLKIIGKGQFDAAKSRNETTFNNINGLTLITSEPNIAVDPVNKNNGYATFVTLGASNNILYSFMEFMGSGVDANPDSIWSVPGTYYIIVYGNATWADQTWNQVDLKISISGNVQTNTIVWAVVGIVLMLASVVVVYLDFKKGGLI